ncbi:methyltransferase [Burkholderia multivorans]|uniref:methyltransferase n=2 Tax=Burkholderia multivorans TaxID=87883 RepID=UPI001ABA53E2|nr:methyltransferase [Burkholderia multivorans]MDN8102631.1 methyltransferase [Burkholderia multivorans]
MKMTREQAKKMQEVEQLIALERRLTVAEREFVLEHYQEGANHDNARMGAFFTPIGLAHDFRIEVPGGCETLVDLCAGIGSLAYACEDKAGRIVCVEQCAEYVRVGRKVMPDATWIHADVFGDWIKEFDGFDVAISNPPFGNRVQTSRFHGRYTGSKFEYKVIELASRIADYGRFIVPQPSAPFRFSGSRHYEEIVSAECRRFMDETGILMEPNCGIDTEFYRKAWHGVTPVCEIVLCDFEQFEQVAPATLQLRAEPMPVPVSQLDLFATA